MKIDGMGHKPALPDNDRLDTRVAPRGAAVPPAAGSSVSLSPLAAQMAAAEPAGAFDAARVEAIRSAIASGEFKVDAGKVADGLIAAVRDLLAAPNRS